MKNVLIVGYGFVGKATELLLTYNTSFFKVTKYDPALKLLAEVKNYDYIFLCVPTNQNIDGTLDTSTLRDAYNQWKDYGNIVIRSTIGPDQVKDFPDAIMMPEFLREKHWEDDVKDFSLSIIVSDTTLGSILRDNLIDKFVDIVGAKEAMMFKLARNSALAMRVALANDFREICERLDINFETLSQLLESDFSVGGSHWESPGPDGTVGFGGKCLPKDLTHMSTLCYNQYNIMNEALAMNLIRRLQHEFN